MAASKGNGLTAGNSQPAKEPTNDSLKFTGPFSKSQRLVLQALANETGIARSDVDYLGDVANGPDLIAHLRARGLGKKHLVCTIKLRTDHFQQLKRFGEYSLSPLGKQAVRRALKVSK